MSWLASKTRDEPHSLKNRGQLPARTAGWGRAKALNHLSGGRLHQTYDSGPARLALADQGEFVLPHLSLLERERAVFETTRAEAVGEQRFLAALNSIPDRLGFGCKVHWTNLPSCRELQRGRGECAIDEELVQRIGE